MILYKNSQIELFKIKVLTYMIIGFEGIQKANHVTKNENVLNSFLEKLLNSIAYQFLEGLLLF